MVISVSDLNGNILAIYRMPDSTIFSIDVALTKARNVGLLLRPQPRPARFYLRAREHSRYQPDDRLFLARVFSFRHLQH